MTMEERLKVIEDYVLPLIELEKEDKKQRELDVEYEWGQAYHIRGYKITDNPHKEEDDKDKFDAFEKGFLDSEMSRPISAEHMEWMVDRGIWANTIRNRR